MEKQMLEALRDYVSEQIQEFLDLTEQFGTKAKITLDIDNLTDLRVDPLELVKKRIDFYLDHIGKANDGR